MSRAENRHHVQRVKNRFYRRESIHPYWGKSGKAAGRYANHGCDCSCAMCGNPRRHFGRATMQELRHLDEHSSRKGIYDGDTDTPCVWHCTDDAPDSKCEAI